MITRLASLCFVVALTAGCGNLCDNANSTLSDLVNKVKTCCPQAANTFSTGNCNTGLGSCSSNDQTKINAYLTCIENLASLTTCTSSAENAFGGQLAACGSNLQGVSDTCVAAFQGMSVALGTCTMM